MKFGSEHFAGEQMACGTSHREARVFRSIDGAAEPGAARSRLNSTIASAKTHQWRLAVLYLDLDNFKRVNDTWSCGRR